MGMFDSVIREPIKCPTCGNTIDDFQSKSGFRQLLSVTPEQLIEDSYRVWGDMEVEYYGYCDECWTEVNFTYHPNNPEKGWEQTIIKEE